MRTFVSPVRPIVYHNVTWMESPSRKASTTCHAHLAPMARTFVRRLAFTVVTLALHVAAARARVLPRTWSRLAVTADVWLDMVCEKRPSTSQQREEGGRNASSCRGRRPYEGVMPALGSICDSPGACCLADQHGGERGAVPSGHGTDQSRLRPPESAVGQPSGATPRIPPVSSGRIGSPLVALLEAHPCRYHDPTRPWVFLSPCDFTNLQNICIR